MEVDARPKTKRNYWVKAGEEKARNGNNSLSKPGNGKKEDETVLREGTGILLLRWKSLERSLDADQMQEGRERPRRER